MNNTMVKCNKCGQEAVDERALKIHKTSKHGEVPELELIKREYDVKLSVLDYMSLIEKVA